MISKLIMKEKKQKKHIHGIVGLVLVLFFIIALPVGYVYRLKNLSTIHRQLVVEDIEQKQNYFFPIANSPMVENLVFQQVIGYSHLYEWKGFTDFKLYPSTSGLYQIGMGKVGLTSLPYLDPVYDKYLARFDASDKLSWARYLDRASYMPLFSIRSIIVDSKENIYVMVYFYTDDFDLYPESFFFFGKWIPRNNRAIIISFNKDGKTRWLRSLKADYSNMHLSAYKKEDKLLVITSSEDNQLNFFHLDPDQGRVLYHKAATMTGEASTFNVSDDLVFIPEFERDDKQKNTFLFRRQGFTFEGELLWSLEDPISFPLDTTIYTINKNCIFVQSNANHMYVAGTFLATPDSYFLRSSHPPQQFAFLYALKPDGTIAWNYTSSVEDDACFTGLQCDMEQIYLMGSSTTNFLPKTATAFQSEPAGGSDYFLWAMDLNGQTRWATFIGGSKDEAIPEDSVLYPREISRRALLRLQGKALILAGSTQSQDYPVKNSLSRSFASHEESQENEKPYYGILSVFSTQGQLQWSSYLHQEATEEQIQETPPSSITLKKIPDNEIILSIECWNQKVYVVSVSSNPYTLLYNPHQRGLFFKEDEKTLEYVKKNPRSYYFLSVVDLE